MKKRKATKPGLAPRPRARKDNPSDNDVHTIAQIMEAHPDPGPEYRAQAIAGWTERELVELGQRYDTDELLPSARRFVSAMLEREFSPRERSVLIGYSPKKVVLLVYEIHRLRELNEEYDARAARGLTRAREEVRRAMSEGIALRDTVERALSTLILPDTPLRESLAAAHGTADSVASLTRSLRELATLLEVFREQTTASARADLDDLALGADLALELRAMVEKIEHKQSLVDGNLGTRVTQRELDHQDGIVLVLIQSLYRAFQYANARMARIVTPPLGRLQRLVGKTSRRAAKEPEPAAAAPPDQRAGSDH